VKNAAQVRQVLEASQKVIAVLQGHRTKARSARSADPYFTVKGLIEGAAPESQPYGIVDVMSDLSVRVSGTDWRIRGAFGPPPPRRCSDADDDLLSERESPFRVVAPAGARAHERRSADRFPPLRRE